MRTNGNTILITGGGSGIGLGLATAFAALGNTVIIAGRTQKTLDTAKAAYPALHTIQADMSTAATVRAFAKTLVADFPALNAVINNAGAMTPETPATNPDTTAAEAMIATNLLGPIWLTTALLPHLIQQPAATIMNVSSGLAFVPLAATPTYCATKAAIHSYSESLRYQLRDTSVAVLELIPPYVQTTLLGAHQAEDPRAMPLDTFITEVMDILTTRPDATEICVPNVLPLYDAAAGGHQNYQQFFTTLNQNLTL